MLAGIVVLLKRAPDQSFNSQMQKKEVADPCAETCPKGALGGVLLNFFGPLLWEGDKMSITGVKSKSVDVKQI